MTAPSGTSLAGSAPRRDVVRRGLSILWLAVREQPRVFTISALGSGLYALMTVASALVLGQVTESVIVPQLEDGKVRGGALAAAALAIIGVAILKAIGIVGRRLWAGVMQYSLQAEYRRRVTRQYLRLPLSWHASHPTGELLSNANADVEATWYPIAPFPFAVGVLLMLAVTLVMLLLTDPVLALIGLFIFPAVALINVVYSRRLSPLMTRAQQLRGDVSGIAHESFDGALVVKTLGREDSETVRFGEGADELRDSMIRVGRVRGTFDPIMEALPNIGVLLVLLIGASRLQSGAINVGQLVRVAYLFTLLAFPIRAIGWVLGELPRSVVGYDRVERVLSATGAQQHGDQQLSADAGPARPELMDVMFHYQGSEPVLSDISLVVRPGSTLAVVGPTGSGKSTLASLLVRLLDPVAGAVRMDDVDLRHLMAGQVPAAAALVPQQTFLFDDTVRGNVALGLPVTDDEIWDALAVAQADGFIAALPQGLDTEIGERGASLSGGQRQRLALARALVRRPRLLVLDDATSSVDPHVEAAILAGLRTADLASTVIVVAYRKATIALADEVIYIEQGRLLGRGTHDELLTTSPGYAHLVTAYERAEAEREAERAKEAAEEIEPEPAL